MNFRWLAIEALFQFNLQRIGLADSAYTRHAFVTLNMLDYGY